jgi:hypothetical protein
MPRRLAVLALLALGVFTRPAAAFFPEPGFYWNTGESGTGYAIELQDNFLFLATYSYRNRLVQPWVRGLAAHPFLWAPWMYYETTR